MPGTALEWALPLWSVWAEGGAALASWPRAPAPSARRRRQAGRRLHASLHRVLIILKKFLVSAVTIELEQ